MIQMPFENTIPLNYFIGENCEKLNNLLQIYAEA